MTKSGVCYRCGRLWGFRSEHLARRTARLRPARCAGPSARWVWAFSVRDIQNIFANVDGQRAFYANKCD
jgi:hypothetical protein